MEGVDTGDRALASAQAGGFDLLLLDVTMPGMGGLDVCRALKSDPRTATDARHDRLGEHRGRRARPGNRARRRGVHRQAVSHFRALAAHARGAQGGEPGRGAADRAAHSTATQTRRRLVGAAFAVVAARASAARNRRLPSRSKSRRVRHPLLGRRRQALAPRSGARRPTLCSEGPSWSSGRHARRRPGSRRRRRGRRLSCPKASFRRSPRLRRARRAAAHTEAGVSLDFDICIRWGAAIADPRQTDPDLLVAAARSAVEKARHAGEPGGIERSVDST